MRWTKMNQAKLGKLLKGRALCEIRPVLKCAPKMNPILYSSCMHGYISAISFSLKVTIKGVKVRVLLSMIKLLVIHTPLGQISTTFRWEIGWLAQYEKNEGFPLKK